MPSLTQGIVSLETVSQNKLSLQSCILYRMRKGGTIPVVSLPCLNSAHLCFKICTHLFFSQQSQETLPLASVLTSHKRVGLKWIDLGCTASLDTHNSETLGILILLFRPNQVKYCRIVLKGQNLIQSLLLLFYYSEILSLISSPFFCGHIDWLNLEKWSKKIIEGIVDAGQW